ncbi:lipase secretion chaperone [Acinetobacter haemolyticus]|uniref:lipase secretion chaperone n=1 Tax=Acinetobacter haemolyticus TaxID=29430 RepID=UPI003C2A03BC
MSVQNFNNKKIILIAIICLIIFLAFIYWIFKPSVYDQSPQNNSHSQRGINSVIVENNSQGQPSGKLPVLAPSLQGTEIDCPLQVDGDGKLILTIGIRSCFDYFFSSLGEKTETELIGDIRQYLRATLPETAANYGIYLLDQYVAYTHALKNLKTSTHFKKDEIDKFQNIVDQMSKLQQQFFNAAEIQAFFGNERNFNQFSIDQMRIHANKTLTAQQKATELAKLIDQLPSTLADGVRVSMQFAELQQLTQEIKEKGGSAQELRNMRESLLGVEAADRLEKVDQEEAVWQNQVNNYLSQRDQILKSDVDDASKQRALNQLRNNSFATKEELLRAQTYEMMHDRKKS